MNIRKKLIQRKLTFGSWLQTSDPIVADIMAATNFEWLAVDCEHTEMAEKDFCAIAYAVSSYDVGLFARVCENSTIAIRKVLDLGANGVIVPLVNNAQEAEQAVKAAKYPPLGIRGFAYCRANKFGKDFSAYCQDANDNIAVIVMAETKEAVENIDEIAAVEGVDGVFIGPYDLSGSYGIPGQTDHKLVKEGCKKIFAACRKADISGGIHLVHPTKENVSEAIESGSTFIALGMDTVFIQNGAKQVFDLKKNLNDK